MEAGELVQRVYDIINKARDDAGNKANEVEEGGDIVMLSGWLNGVEDALAEVAKEVEKLSSPSDKA